MVRTQIYLPEELHRDLKILAFHEGVSLGEILRKGAELLRRKPLIKAYHRVAKKARKSDELKDFHLLAKRSFDFWNNPEDDIYQQFYSNVK